MNRYFHALMDTEATNGLDCPINYNTANRLTIGTSTRLTSMVNAPALIGEAMKCQIILATVTPMLKIKLTQTAAFVTFFQYKPYINGARNAPASAPHE